MNLKGKNIIVTGLASSRSISFAIIKAYHQRGAKIIATYQNDRLADRSEKLIREIGDNIDLYPCDLSSDQEINNLKEQIISNYKKLSGIIHSAAFAPKEMLSGNYLDSINREGFNMAHDISSYSLTALVKSFYQNLEENSSIITLSYIGSQRVIQNYNIMGIAKASLEASVKYLADSVGDKGIRVNAISAGPIKTLAAAGIKGFNKILEVYENKSPIKKNITTDDVANVACFLMSDLSRSITGQTIYVDNGYNIKGY